jgi:phage-related protein
MAAGFHVASAYISVETEDDTDRGRKAIEEKGHRWAGQFGAGLGKGVGKAFGRVFASAVSAIFSGVLKPLLVLGAVQLASAITTALAPAMNALLLLPAAVATAAAAIATLKIAFSGLGTAISAGWSGDLEAMAQAMEKLAPAAREAVKAVVGLKPLVDSLKQSVQQATFDKLGEQITKVGRIYLPILQTGLTGIGRSFNQMFRDMAALAQTPQFKLTFVETLGNAGKIIGNLTNAFAPILSGLNSIAAAGSRVFAKLTAEATEGASHWAAKMNEMMENGALEEMIYNALDVIGQLFKLFRDVFATIGQVLDIASQAGGGILDTLVQGAAAMRAWVESAEGIEFLTVVFESVHATFAALQPVIMAVLGAVKDAIMVIAPVLPQVAAALAPLGPALAQALGPIAQMIAVLAPVLGQVLAAAAPLLPVLGQLIGLLGGIFAQALQLLMPMITQLAALIAVFAPDLMNLIKIFADGLLPVLAEIGQAILDALVIVLPILLQLFTELAPPILEVIGALADALLPVLPVLAQLFADIVKAITPLIVLFIKSLVPIIHQLAPLFMELAVTLGQMLLAALSELLPVFMELLPLIMDIAVMVLPALVPLVGLLAEAFYALLPVIKPLIDAFLPILMKILTNLVPIIRLAADVFGFLVKNVLTPLINVVVTVITWIANLFRAMTDLENIGRIIGGFFAGMVRGAVTAVTTVVEFFGNLGRKILEKLANAGMWLIQKGKDIVNGLGSGIVNAFKSVGAWFAGLPSKLWEMVKSAGSWLFETGKKLVQGLIDGIQRMFGDFKRKIAELAAEVSGLNGLLGIQSPSRVTMETGRNIVRGLLRGVAGMVPELEAQIGQIAGLFTGGVNGQFNAQAGSIAVNIPTMASAPPPPIYVVADFGDGVRKVIGTDRERHPTLYAAATDEGRRHRGWVHSPRAKK